MAHVAHKAKPAKAAVKRSQKKEGDAAGLQHAKKITGAIQEAEQIHKGKRRGKSFDEFLGEL